MPGTNHLAETEIQSSPTQVATNPASTLRSGVNNYHISCTFDYIDEMQVQSSFTASLADPQGSNALVVAVQWLRGTLLSTVATTIAVIAVAPVGVSDARRADGLAAQADGDRGMLHTVRGDEHCRGVARRGGFRGRAHGDASLCRTAAGGEAVPGSDAHRGVRSLCGGFDTTVGYLSNRAVWISLQEPAERGRVEMRLASLC